MYKGKLILTVICARGGSKRLPRKNLKNLLGKPLIAHTIEHAKACKFIDRLIVSTDDAEIANVAEQLGVKVPFLRPAHLATDTSTTESAVIHALQFAEKHFGEKYDIVILLDPTNPVRTTKDIQNTLDLLLTDQDIESVISVVEAQKNPYFNMLELNTHGYVELSKKLEQKPTRFQDAPRVYSANASIYAAKLEPFIKHQSFLLEKTKPYIMPEDSMFDIDRPLDFEFVSFLLKRRLGQVK